MQMELERVRNARMDWVRKQVDSSDCNALHVAASFNNLDVIKALQNDLSEEYMTELARAEDTQGNTIAMQSCQGQRA